MRTTQVSVTGVTTSAWLPLDPYGSVAIEGIFLKTGAGATVSVEVTGDNVLDSSVTPVAFACGVAALTAAVANAAAGLLFPARAIRLNQTVGATTSTVQVVARGI
jgi:hypothetical protein